MTDSLSSGQSLNVGDYLTSSNGLYTLHLQGDGNLVLYGPGFYPYWSSATTGKAAQNLIMQGDGNLVLYADAHGHATWASNTVGNPDSHVVLQGDGNLVIYNSSGKTLWATNTAQGPQPPSAPDKLLAGQSLNVNQSIVSTDGRFRLILQGDGNLVLYGPGGHAWASNTVGSQAANAAMQGDGNFVLYNSQSKPVWATNTSSPGSWLVLQSDRNIVIYSDKGKALWASGTAEPSPPLPPILPAPDPDKLLPGQSLDRGDAIVSQDDRFHFTLENDGNLTLRDVSKNVLVWQTNTGAATDPPSLAAMQSDGNFVLYDTQSKAVWATNTATAGPASFLVIQDDRNVVLYSSPSGSPSYLAVWATNTMEPKNGGTGGGPGGTGGGHHGVSEITLTNENSDSRDLSLWAFDETTGGSWTRLGGVPYGQTFLFKPPADAHIYLIEAIDYLECGEDDPANVSCVRWSVRIESDPNGPVAPYAIS